MYVTLYKRPHGRKEVIDMTKIYPEDEQWFVEHDVKISMEDLGFDFVVYADIGLASEDGDPDEITAFANKRTCEETMKLVRQRCEEALKTLD